MKFVKRPSKASLYRWYLKQFAKTALLTLKRTGIVCMIQFGITAAIAGILMLFGLLVPNDLPTKALALALLICGSLSAYKGFRLAGDDIKRDPASRILNRGDL